MMSFLWYNSYSMVMNMIKYYCSGFNVNDPFGYGLGTMIQTELKDINSVVYIVGSPKDLKKIEKAENVYKKNFDESFKRNGIVFENSYIIKPDTNPKVAKKMIDESSFLMLMGGDPFDQKEMCENLGIINNIKNYKGIMMGFSAGAMLMSKYIIITPCSDEYPDFHIAKGLNLDNISIYPHNNTNKAEYPNVLDTGEETYKKQDILKVANEYGKFYLLQDYQRKDGLFDISIIKVNNGHIEFYTESDGKIWEASDDIDLITTSN